MVRLFCLLVVLNHLLAVQAQRSDLRPLAVKLPDINLGSFKIPEINLDLGTFKLPDLGIVFPKLDRPNRRPETGSQQQQQNSNRFGTRSKQDSFNKGPFGNLNVLEFSQKLLKLVELDLFKPKPEKTRSTASTPTTGNILEDGIGGVVGEIQGVVRQVMEILSLLEDGLSAANDILIDLDNFFDSILPGNLDTPVDEYEDDEEDDDEDY